MRAWIGYECKLRDVRLASSEETRSSITIKDMEGSDAKGWGYETRPNNKTGTNSRRMGYFSSVPHRLSLIVIRSMDLGPPTPDVSCRIRIFRKNGDCMPVARNAISLSQGMRCPKPLSDVPVQSTERTFRQAPRWPS